MGEADFGSVNSAIAGCFDESEYFGITRTEYDTLNGSLYRSEYGSCEWTLRLAFSEFIVTAKGRGPKLYLAKRFICFYLVIIQSLKASVS